MVRFLMFLTRTCIGDNGLSNRLDAICEPLVSGLNPVYVYKQKKVALREEMKKCVQVRPQKGQIRDLNS